MRILLIDDDESNRVTLAALLEDDGFEVDVAASSSAARAKLALPGAWFDAVLLDQHLGDGLGTNLVPLIRERSGTTKIIMISGSLAAGETILPRMDGALGKGESFEALVGLIRAVLGRA